MFLKNCFTLPVTLLSKSLANTYSLNLSARYSSTSLFELFIRLYSFLAYL
nr:MAG TPA: hypothetical protein [Caudoviricetes sp.]